MAESVVSLVLETITKLLIEEKKFLSGVSDEAEKLSSELKMMQAFLRDADKKQHEERVQECVSQCRDLAYKAENVLEDYAFKISSIRRTRSIFSVVKRFACILNECLIRHSVGSEIQALNTRISDLTKCFRDYGINALTQGEGSSGRPQQWRMTYSYDANDEDIVGIKRDIQKLKAILVTEEIGVVSITGMGGCGKTTLARKVYNHPDVKSHFDRFAWVCISQQWNRRDILQEILMSFLPKDEVNGIQNWREDKIVEILVSFQKERKCLVVLDDIWDSEAWETIKPAFPLNKKGNKILITTRKINVAAHIGPNGYHHQSGLLNDSESYELLLKKAFGTPANPELEDIDSLKRIGKEMVKSCGGLPLAVIVLGGILANKHSFNEWEAVSKNIRSYLGKGDIFEEGDAGVQRFLSLSYDDLPYKLKPCFLYMSIFSEDERIDTDRLYNLWIAEGIVSAEDRIGNDESIKEVAGRYLGELVKRCIVMVQVEEKTAFGRSVSFYLHDLMRDLCRSKAREEKFLMVFDKALGRGDMELVEMSFSEFSRVLINSIRSKDTSKRILIRTKSYKSLRALGYCAERPTELILQLEHLGIDKFTMLRSLIIENVIDPMTNWGFSLPIGKLIHLRQLSLRKSELVLSPSSVSKLEHLEILDLRGSTIMWTKSGVIRARRLKYLYLPEYGYVERFHVPTICVSSDLEVIYGQLPNGRLHVENLSGLTNNIVEELEDHPFFRRRV